MIATGSGAVLRDVTVVDVRQGSATPHQDIRVRDGRIASISATGTTSGEHVIEGQGAFVVPGYLDMHAHPMNDARPDPHLAAMGRAGITGFRQMSGTTDLLEQRRHRSLVPAGAPTLLAMPGELLTPLNAGSPEAAVAEVVRQAHAGADFIKVALVGIEAFEAAQEEAARIGIPVAGHLPAGVDVRTAARRGLRCIEHLGPGSVVLGACSSEAKELQRLAVPRREFPAPPHSPLLRRALSGLVDRRLRRLVLNPTLTAADEDIALLARAIETFDEQIARELARLFVEEETWHCPTLVRLRAQEQCCDPSLDDDALVGEVDPATRRTWRRTARRFERRFDGRQRDTLDAVFELQLLLTRILDEEGVGLLAGTDCVGAAWVAPGTSLHQEFELLARAGLTPARILRMATLDAARFLGRTSRIGAVEVGWDADLVLLDADPLIDVRHLSRIREVLRGQRAL